MDCVVCGTPIESLSHPPSLPEQFCSYACMGKLGRMTQLGAREAFTRDVTPEGPMIPESDATQASCSAATTALDTAVASLLSAIGVHCKQIADSCDRAAAMLGHNAAPPVADIETAAATSLPMESPAMTAEELRSKMTETGVSSRKLADALGISPQNIDHWRAGRYRIPPKHVPRILALLKSKADQERPALAPSPTPAPAIAQRGALWNGSSQGLMRLLRDLGMSQSELAAAWGVSACAVSTWRSGRTRVNDAMLRRINDVMREWLFQRGDDGQLRLIK